MAVRYQKMRRDGFFPYPKKFQMARQSVYCNKMRSTYCLHCTNFFISIVLSFFGLQPQLYVSVESVNQAILDLIIRAFKLFLTLFLIGVSTFTDKNGYCQIKYSLQLTHRKSTSNEGKTSMKVGADNIVLFKDGRKLQIRA